MNENTCLHFVGSMPQFDDARSALRWQLTTLAGSVRRLSGGETGDRLLWFVPLVKDIKRLPQVRTIQNGDWTGYRDIDVLRVRRRARFTRQDIPLRMAEFAREELGVLDSLDNPHGLPLQVGVPGYLDMALYTFGPMGLLRYGRMFLGAVAGQIAELQAEAGDRIVFQLEVPAALIAVAAAPPPLRPAMAALMAHLVTRQVARAPEGSRFGVHLCLGDLGHQALLQLADTDPLVRLTNALVRHWPDGRSLEFVHLPMSGADQPPVVSPDFFDPLRRLRVPPDVPVVAGIAHEDQGLDEQLTVRRLVETALGRRVDIATACGLGRRSPQAARRAVDAMLALQTAQAPR
ncbi:hypothetical protein ACQPXM_24910 [Kribbella sp. CA-253562]|uniref:hypothetical protein n=1 Tax=Kribbella sp. CA-253562 TaxID=3239942 RepID=UPI003D8E81FB